MSRQRKDFRGALGHGPCVNPSLFIDGLISQILASMVLEHFAYSVLCFSGQVHAGFLEM